MTRHPLLPELALTLPGLALLIATPGSAQDAPSPHAVDTAYVPGEYRVFTGAGEPASLEEVVGAMGRHDVIFLGETHDDPTGHMLELELLERAWGTYGPSGSAPRAPRPIALSLEFFERDVQPILDEYLAGLITESAFRADSRPWPRYGTDYRPLVEFAKERGMPVLASNAPRRYVSRVSADGRAAFDALAPWALGHLPPLPYGEPSPAYRDQWIATIAAVMEKEGMKCGVPVENPPAPVGAHAGMGNQLHAQVLWDASMAWWVSRHLEDEPGALVLHVVGGFHVERGTGIPEHLQAYAPGARSMTVMLRPVDDVEVFERVPDAPAGEWGDFVIQTDGSRTLEAIECRGMGGAG